MRETADRGGNQHLLLARRFLPLVVTQAMTAFDDNLLKNALIVLASFRISHAGPGFSALAGAVFLVPYFLLSASFGQIADRYPKRGLIILLKAIEVPLMLAAFWGFAQGSTAILLWVLLGLGIEAAAFGPVKYAILPEHLYEDELIAGNGVIETLTFVAILLGTIGGALVLNPVGPVLVSWLCVGASVIGLGAAFAIPCTAAAAPDLPIGLNILRETWDLVQSARKHRCAFDAILGAAWFWAVGFTILAQFPALVRDSFGAGGEVVSLFLGLFAFGVGAGGLICARVLRGEVSPRLTPWAGVGMSLVLADFAGASAGMPMLPTVAAFFSTFAGIRILTDLFLLALFGGVFSVPLNAVVQELAPAAQRARFIGVGNVIAALAMILGAGLAALASWWGMAIPQFLIVLAGVNLLVCVWCVRFIPLTFWLRLLRHYFLIFHRAQVRGLQNYRDAGDRVVVVSNHLSFGDACFIAAFLPGEPAFAIHTQQMQSWFVRMLGRLVNVFPVDINNPYSIKTMIEAVRDRGKKLVIFPEGRITSTGGLMKIYEGASVVADKAVARVVPVAIDGPQFTPLGHMRGKYAKLRWFSRLSLTVFPAVSLTPANAHLLTPHERRHAVGRAMADVMIWASFMGKPIDDTLFGAAMKACAQYGGKTPIFEDAGRAPLSYQKFLIGACVLGRKLSESVALEEHVGILLPNASASMVTFFGLNAFGRVPCMLNFTAGAHNILLACQATQVRVVISSRAFIEKAKLEKLRDQIQDEVEFIWLEDLRGEIGVLARLRGVWDLRHAAKLPGAGRAPRSEAVVLFTSGSEGTPKGVVLSHRNILASCAQIGAMIDFSPTDRVFNALPIFHSFGLVDATILPILAGVKVFLYPSPLHYRTVPALIYDTSSTICFGTDTFLNGWAKYAHPYDFYTMRYVVAGAEPIREETKALFASKFGARIFEGYGATETAPVLTLNTAMQNRACSVGRLLPGIAYVLEPVPGIDAGGKLVVRGPNVMLGYLRPDRPGEIEAPVEGWYDTGDIVDVDDDGFFYIVGRVKRFAKIGGEMISMQLAENVASAVWPEAAHAVIAVKDARKGEDLVLFTTQKSADSAILLQGGRSRGIADIAIPRRIVEIAAMPLLGNGKINYPALQNGLV